MIRSVVVTEDDDEGRCVGVCVGHCGIGSEWHRPTATGGAASREASNSTEAGSASEDLASTQGVHDAARYLASNSAIGIIVILGAYSPMCSSA